MKKIKNSSFKNLPDSVLFDIVEESKKCYPTPSVPISNNYESVFIENGRRGTGRGSGFRNYKKV